MDMALALLLCIGLIALGAGLWYGVERRTERLVAREKRETERWRKAYTDLQLRNLPPWEEGLSPMPLQLDDQDGLNLQTYGRTAKKRIKPQRAQA